MYKLIILDDEPMISEQLPIAYDWADMGFEVVASFDSGKKALDYIRENPIDVLLTDIKMPDISGIDIANICHDEYPDICVIFISAFREFDYAIHALSSGVIDYILKPIDEDALRNALNKAKKHLSNQQRIMHIPSKTSRNMIINEVLAYINEHYSETITVEIVAQHVMMNPDYFGAYFKKHYGKNFVEVLRDTRMKKACEKLSDPSIKISAIAEDIGYKSLTHFYDVFFKYYNVTPAQYRKSLYTNEETDDGRRDE